VNSLESPGVSPQPAWLELPEKAEYWACRGIVEKSKWWQRRRTRKSLGWIVLSYSKEDAEAFAATPNSLWTWDGNPAHPIFLKDAMREARTTARPGVKVQSYQDGDWRTVKKYPAGQPLPEVER